VSGGFQSVVVGHRSSRRRWKRAVPTDRRACFLQRSEIARPEEHHLPRLAFSGGRQGAAMTIVHHVVAFPVSELCSFFDCFGSFGDVHTVWYLTDIPIFSPILLSPEAMRAA